MHVESLQAVENTEPGIDSALRVVFVTLGVAKIHQETVAKILRDMLIITLDDFSTDLLICTDDCAILFGIELGREFRGVHQITEHDRELPSFRVRRRRSS